MNLHEKIGNGVTKEEFAKYLSKYKQIFMGVDWSGGGRGVKTKDGTQTLVSRTAVVILGIRSNGEGDIIAHKVFVPEITQPESVRDIIQLFKTYKCSMVGADAGEGSLGNGFLREALGHHKVIPMRYSGKLAAKAKWHRLAECYILHKTTMIDNTLMLIKRGVLHFSNYTQCKTLFDDILAEYEETSATGERIWSHSSRTPDDSLHALVFGYCVYRACMGNLNYQYSEEFLK
jgi:hypothetical protein